VTRLRAWWRRRRNRPLSSRLLRRRMGCRVGPGRARLSAVFRAGAISAQLRRKRGWAGRSFGCHEAASIDALALRRNATLNERKLGKILLLVTCIEPGKGCRFCEH
jgi:hypothetical protein